MTLTLPIVNRARRVLFLVTGRDKAEMLRRVHIEGDESLPASHVHPGDGELLWLVDDAAWAG
jgi:6-phosphogluconolactonase